jgi:hypothetical protein
MTNKIKETAFVLILIFAFSYVFNFVWESFHAVYLYEDHKFSSEHYVPMINYVSTMDGLIISGIYIVASLIWRNLLWIKSLNRINIITFLVLGLADAVIIEYRSVYVLNKWSYNSIMPTIFGIGVSPLVQLSLTGMLALIVTKRILYPQKFI